MDLQNENDIEPEASEFEFNEEEEFKNNQIDNNFNGGEFKITK